MSLRETIEDTFEAWPNGLVASVWRVRESELALALLLYGIFCRFERLAYFLLQCSSAPNAQASASGVNWTNIC